MEVEAGHFLGYPCTREFDYTPLYPFLAYLMNNVGDPFIKSNYHLNSHSFEREVIQFFAQLTRADEDGIWGYVTNCGTEGNWIVNENVNRWSLSEYNSTLPNTATKHPRMHC